MKVIKTKWFAKWAKKNAISECMLFTSAQEILEGRYEADYGSGILKKRVASKGRGKSGSVRTIVVYKHGSHCFFVCGFEKNALYMTKNLSCPRRRATINDIAQ